MTMTDSPEPVAPPVTPEPLEHWETRARFRDDLLEAFRTALGSASRTLSAADVAAWDGVAVVTRRQWTEAIAKVAETPLPPLDQHSAEVVTTADVTVWTVCPRCNIAGPIRVQFQPELRVDVSGAELRLKAKAKPRTHACGQLTTPAAADENADEQLTVDDLVGEAEDIVQDNEPAAAAAESPAPRRRLRSSSAAAVEPLPAADDDLLPGEPLNLGACPWPGCQLADEHPGAHQTAVDDRPQEGES